MAGLRQVVVAAAVAALAAGCTTTVPGSVAMTTVAAPADAVDLALLDPGNFPTKPRPPLGEAGSANAGGFLEGARLADNVVGPWEVDPALIRSVMPSAGPKPSTLAAAFSKDVAQAALDHHLVALFTTNRSNAANDKDLINAVLRFPTPEDAGAATTDIVAALATFTFGDTVTRYDPIAIPGHPDTAGLTHHFDSLGKWDVDAVTAHGPYVLIQWVESKVSAEAGAELAAATLDKQGPLIDQFQPTPVDQLKDLPIDSDGLLARTLPPDEGAGDVYQPRGELHYHADPPRSHTVFDAARVQQAARGATTVYQTPDAASAQRIVDGFAAEAAEEGLGGGKLVPVTGIKGLPGTKCLVNKDKDRGYFYCLAAAGRYAIEAMARQEPETYQLVSAQYLMLTSK